MTSTTDRAEVNRRNGARGGPKTPEGKARSRFNALKHGMSAKLPVLPQEDPEAYRQRLDAWMTHLEPRNPVEQFLIEQAVTASWRLERADRMETASLTDRLDGIQAQRDLKRRIEAHELARRLLPAADAELERAILEIYLKDPFLHYLSTDLRNGTDESGDEPESILARLVATDVGGHWLLGRWRRLGAILDRGEDWRLDDLAEALRLTGRKPLGLGTKAWNDRRAQVGKETDPRPAAELELQLLRQFDPDLPADRGEARAALSPMGRADARTIGADRAGDGRTRGGRQGRRGRSMLDRPERARRAAAALSPRPRPRLPPHARLADEGPPLAERHGTGLVRPGRSRPVPARQRPRRPPRADRRRSPDPTR